MVGVRRESVIQTCDSADFGQSRGVRGGEVVDGGCEARGFDEGVAPGAAVDVD